MISSSKLYVYIFQYQTFSLNKTKKNLRLAQSGEHETKYANTAYGMSKVGLTALSRIQQRTFNVDPRPDIIVNSMTPGYCKTDMTSNLGNLTPEQGADTIIYLSLLPTDGNQPKGEFCADRKPIDWEDMN